jgi:two-component system sensor histidine kinase MprB
MPLRRRITLVAAAVVAVAVAAAVVVSFYAVRGQLMGQIDNELTEQAVQVQNNPVGSLLRGMPALPAKSGGPIPYWQIVSASGDSLGQSGGVNLPGRTLAASVAARKTHAYFTNVHVGGTTLREYVFPLLRYVVSGQAVAIQLAQPLQPTNNVLSRLRWILGGIFLAVVALAAILARMATRRVLKPLGQVTATAELIGETDDLSQRIQVQSEDEVGQLADRFNQMLARLERSRDDLDASVTAQRQLVADASHELRTPVTSLRTNIEVLLASDALDPEDRRRLLTDVVEQSEELTTLVSDLIEVARGDLPSEAVEDMRLDVLVEEALARARRHAPETEFSARLSPTMVDGNPERLSRAINNLLDNAARHTVPGTPVEVVVDDAGLRVRDHGTGIDPADLPYIFDRFYRGANSRARQGSGLGLAIVRQVAEQHQGSVSATNATGGGALFTLRLPTVGLEPGHENEPSDLHDATDYEDYLWSSSGARADPAPVSRNFEAAPKEGGAEQEDGDTGQQHEYPVTRHASEDRD